jgi:hypothetical protein
VIGEWQDNEKLLDKVQMMHFFQRSVVYGVGGITRLVFFRKHLARGAKEMGRSQ